MDVDFIKDKKNKKQPVTDVKDEIEWTRPSPAKIASKINSSSKQEDLVRHDILIKTNDKKIKKKPKPILERIKESFREERAEQNVRVVSASVKMIDEIIKDSEILKIFSVLIEQAIVSRVSHIHLEPAQKDGRIRMRLDGKMSTFLVLPKDKFLQLVTAFKDLASLNEKNGIPKVGSFNLIVAEKEYHIKLSVMPVLNTEKVVVTIFDKIKPLPSLSELDFREDQLSLIKTEIIKPGGLILVNGHNQSGKTTTIFSILNELNSDKINISTVEDSIDYIGQGMNQTQIKPSIGLTFSSALRSVLRQDSNVIYVSEISDSETAQLAVYASLSKHLVISSLYVKSALSAVVRLIDIGLDPEILINSLKFSVWQKLLRKNCDKCSQEEKVDDKTLVDVKKELLKIDPKILNKIKNFDIDNFKFSKGRGCSFCGNTGYNGQIMVSEIFILNNDIKKLVGKNKDLSIMNYLYEGDGFVTLEQDALIKAVRGLISIEEFYQIFKNV